MQLQDPPFITARGAGNDTPRQLRIRRGELEQAVVVQGDCLLCLERWEQCGCKSVPRLVESPEVEVDLWTPVYQQVRSTIEISR